MLISRTFRKFFGLGLTGYFPITCKRPSDDFYFTVILSLKISDQYVYPEELGNRDKIRRESVLKDLLNDLRVEKISDNKKSRPKPKKPKSDPLEKQVTDDKKIEKKPAISQEKYKPKKVNAEKYQPPSKQRSKQLKAEKT